MLYYAPGQCSSIVVKCRLPELGNVALSNSGGGSREVLLLRQFLSVDLQDD